MSEDLYWLGFSAFHGIGPAKFAILLKTFGSAQASWMASQDELEKAIGPKTAQDFIHFRDNFSVQKYHERLADRHIFYSLLGDAIYPPLLAKTKRAPFVLYAKGNKSVLRNAKTIAIVGTRKITPYGSEVTTMFAQELSMQGFTIISGLALGVDALAHTTALQTGGATIAVLGSGVDVCTPVNNQLLYDEILEKGSTIVSEFAFEDAIGKGVFPARNRIVAGISQAVLVTEGAQDSGALITARLAQEMGKPVFAVPGPITSGLSKGTNTLIATGAIAATQTSDILDTLGIIEAKVKTQAAVLGKKSAIKSCNTDEQKILSLLENGPLHFDEIVRSLKNDSKTIGSFLGLMELKGMVKSTADGKYSLN